MSDQSHRSTSRVVAGVAVMALGVLFTLDNVGVVPAREVLRWWPALLVFWGFTRLVGFGRGRVRPVSGSILVVVGSWWLLHNIGVVNHGVFDLWPLLLVFLGVAIIRRGYWGYRKIKFGYVGRGARRFGEWPVSVHGLDEEFNPGGAGGTPTAPPSGAAAADPAASPGRATEAGRGPATPGFEPAGAASDPGSAGPGSQGPGAQSAGPADAGPGPGAGGPYDPSSVLKVDVFMSSVSRKVASQHFRGGEVVAIMGGGDIDLRSAKIEGQLARLEINLVMGGVNLFVPDDWVVEYQGTPIMGGVEDTSRRPAGPPAGRLVVTGALLWSAIVIKN